MAEKIDSRPCAGVRAKLARHPFRVYYGDQEILTKTIVISTGSSVKLMGVRKTTNASSGSDDPAGTRYRARRASTPTSSDVAVLMSVQVIEEFRGKGIGRQLVQSAAGLLTRRDMRALEATVKPSGD